MEPLLVSAFPHLQIIDFDILAKSYLLAHNLKLIHSEQPTTWDWLSQMELDLRKVKPWWSVHIIPSMLAIEDGNPFRGGKVTICTYSNMIMPGQENYSHRVIFEGNPSTFSLEYCVDRFFPNLVNANDCIAAIKSYATFLGLAIIGVETGVGGQQVGIGIMVNGKIINAELLQDVQIRARTRAYLKQNITLLEHTQRAQIMAPAGLDAWINLGCENDNNPPTFTQQMADLANRYFAIQNAQSMDPRNIVFMYIDLINSAPDFIAPRVNFAHLLRGFKMYPQALQSVQWALSYAPEDRDAWITQAIIYADMGERSKSRNSLMNAFALSIGPEQAEVKRFLSQI